MSVIEKKLSKGISVIECKDITFTGKDIITIKDVDDFLYLLGGSVTIFKLQNKYYIISSDVVYIFEGNV